MAELSNNGEPGKEPKNPNFLAVVIISAAVLILIFLGAYFVVGAGGRRILPPKHRDPQPTSCLSYPNSSSASPALPWVT
jgi:hypothetical protein